MGSLFSLKMLLVMVMGAVVVSTATIAYQYLPGNQRTFSNNLSLQYISPVTSEPSALILNLSNPEENSLVFEKDLLIQGKSSPKATIVLSSDDEDLVVEAKSEGDFSTVVKLKNGANEFLITAFDHLGNSKSERRVIYYSPEKL